MNQRNGAELFGTNDPRSSSIGIIEVAPDDDRRSILTALLTQDKLQRKQTVIVLPEQCKAIRNASDFKDFEGALARLHTQPVFVAPKNSLIAKLARQHNYQVFVTLDNYAQYARTFLSETLAASPPPSEQSSTPPAKSPARTPKGKGKEGDKGSAKASPPPPPSPSIDQEATRPLAPTSDKPAPPQAAQKTPPPTTPGKQNTETKEGPAQTAETDTRERQKQKKNGATVEPTPIILGDPVEEPPPPPPVPQSAPPAGNHPKQKSSTPEGTRPKPPDPRPVPPPEQDRPLPVPVASAPPLVLSPLHPVGSPHRNKQLGKPGWLIVAGLILLIVVIIGGSIGSWLGFIPLTRIFPGLASATITVFPDSKPFQKTYTITASSANNLKNNEIALHFLPATMGNATKKVQASGKGVVHATIARGELTFYNRLATPQHIPAGTVLTASTGLQVITQENANLPGANRETANGIINESQTSVLARALLAGKQGNIPAFTFTRTLSLCCNPGVSVENSHPFTGGEEEQTYTYVQQSDIDQAASELKNQLLQKKELQPQLQDNEQLIDPVQCITSTFSDSEAGDHTDQVQVSVELACSGAFYNRDEVKNQAASLLIHDSSSQFDANYMPLHLDSKVVSVNKDNLPTQALLQITARGLWVYQFPEDKQQDLIKQVTGKSQKAAQTSLQSIPGIQKVAIDLPWYAGGTLPTEPQQIKLVVQTP